MLCQPLSKILSCRVTSMTNLKKLIHRSHPTSVAKFQTCIDNYKITRKRKKTKESENNPVKRKMLPTLVTDKCQLISETTRSFRDQGRLSYSLIIVIVSCLEALGLAW